MPRRQTLDIVLVSMALSLAACHRPAPAPLEGATVMITTAAVEDALVAQPISATGVVASKEAPTLSFKVGGIVGRVLVDGGQSVRAGQLLATLDLRESDAILRRADEGVQRAEREAARASRLYRDSVATLQQVQDATTALEVARADRQIADVNRRYATIIAPGSGTVLRRHVDPGELVAAGAPVVSLAIGGRGTVLRIGLADRDVVRVHAGDVAQLAFDARPDVPIVATVREIAAAADPLTGTYQVELAIVAPPSWLASGMIGRARLEPRGKVRARLVPVTSVLEADADHGAVFILDAAGERVHRRAVRIGFIDGSKVAILSGLDDVREVVTGGAPFLREGSTVRRTSRAAEVSTAGSPAGAS